MTLTYFVNRELKYSLGGYSYKNNTVKIAHKLQEPANSKYCITQKEWILVFHSMGGELPSNFVRTENRFPIDYLIPNAQLWNNIYTSIINYMNWVGCL